MKEIEQKIIESYVPHETTLRYVATVCGTDHHHVKRVLEKNDIKIFKGKRPPFTKEHREKIGAAGKGRIPWSKGKKMPKESLYKNMIAHIRFDIDYNWIIQFEDIERLKLLNRAISKRKDRYDVTVEWYKKYVEKYYYDSQFNTVYKHWLSKNKCKWVRPTIDHIIPVSKGGTNELGNLQFLTWLENRCKVDIEQSKWNEIKENLNDYFI